VGLRADPDMLKRQKFHAYTENLTPILWLPSPLPSHYTDFATRHNIRAEQIHKILRRIVLFLILHFLHGLSWELQILATELHSLIDKLSHRKHSVVKKK
jgi:hypothetical protein